MSAPRVRLGDVVALPGFVDWDVIVTDIKAALGFDHDSQVADLLNVPRTTFARWLIGFEPGYAYGAAVMELHALACGEACTRSRIASMKERATRAPS